MSGIVFSHYQLELVYQSSPSKNKQRKNQKLGSEEMGHGDEFSLVERKDQEGITWWEETQVSWVSQGKEGKKERKGMRGIEDSFCLLCLLLLRQRWEMSLLW